MYEGLILIDPDVDITAQQLLEELRRFYAGKAGEPSDVTLSDETVVLHWPDYELAVGRSALPHVLEESAEIAKDCGADHPAKDRIARCSRRFEMSGPADPNMDHFNDSLFVGEALERLGRVYRFDQGSGEFLE